ncbi:uncharacterized protein LOC132270162 [Cornus florida]|uniref:uncharacterized protein LOC132270162 n=1 Tax=Cornus florida TaxID=4283 RepID=UPI0028978923|nr:uncharacterized protein LOC132270162 [Cornus florida]
MGEIKIVKDHLFDDIKHFRTMLKKHCVQKGFKQVMGKNERKIVTSHCGNPGCQWGIRASLLPDKVTFKVKRVGSEHTCIITTKNPIVTSTFIVDKLANKFRNQPNIDLEILERDVRDTFKVEVTKVCLRRARKKALEQSEGTHIASYKKLWPFIGLDGYFLKGPFGSILICAVGLDGNNGLYPFAVAVVDSEREKSWKWFLEHLHKIIGDTAGDLSWVIITHGQKGILPAVDEVYPHASKRRCCSPDPETPKSAVHPPARYATDHLSPVPPPETSVVAALPQFTDAAGTCELIWPGGEFYEVTEELEIKYIVNLHSWFCDCGEWQLISVTCKHAATCITWKREHIEECCDDFFSSHSYLKAYKNLIHPIHYESKWDEVNKVDLLPSDLKMPIVRPRVARKREYDEPQATKRSTILRYSICKESGHNKRGYQRAPIQNKKKKGSRTSTTPSTSTATPSITAPTKAQQKKKERSRSKDKE